MSVLIIRNDDSCDVYNRTIVICYTKMSMDKLESYVTQLELLADDRQKLFFKIDFDIFSAPKSMPELEEWKILTFVLKSYHRQFSFGIFVKLFFEKFPCKLMVDYSNMSIFVCSGNYDDGKSLSGKDFESFAALADYHKKMQNNIIEVSKIFKSKVTQPADAPKVLVELARKYDLRGGRWIMFFNKLDLSRWEKAFKTLFSEARRHWGVLDRFSAKISSDAFIICFGNETTLSATDPALLDPALPKDVSNDPGPLEVLKIIDEIYSPAIFGCMGVKYKPDIISACCIQRDNFIRPTVYNANYGEYSRNFQPLGSTSMVSMSESNESLTSAERLLRSCHQRNRN